MDTSVLRIIYLIYLLVAAAIALFDWVYLREILRVKQIIGMSSPPFITKLLKINFAFSLFLVIFLIITLFVDFVL